ncbi:hypothetical protein Clacol_008923 [Clathrus columnatus]|uniref:Uncharacterized protein n=1 Tax=Clathrus columnatus TaxID=1419009 RepID=A0AAV5AJ24_9AGAM|nr:hypothetical protein Clacol_008923 [Clathrus columnatus]
MSPSKPLKVGLLGAAHVPALAELKSIISLSAVYSRSLKSAVTLAEIAKDRLNLSSPPPVYHDQGGKDADLDALLSSPDIDAVIIALPITVQPDIIKKALAHGKHVLSEKPIAPSVAEGIDLINEYEKNYKGKLIWRVAENEEASPANRKTGELITQGVIGTVTWWNLTAVGSLSEDSPWYKTPWRAVPEYQGGFLLDGGVHSAAVLRIALPSHPTHLSAHVSLNLEHLAPKDTLIAVVQSSDGSHGLFERSEGGPSVSRKSTGFKITGNEGWIHLRPENGVQKITVHKVTEKSEEVEEFEYKEEGVKKELEYWAQAVLGEPTIDVGNPWETLRDVAFIEAGLKSKGERFDLEKLLKEGK